MKYNLADRTQLIAARSRITYLSSKQQIVDITKVSRTRTLKQNSYLHLLLGLYALETGYTIEEAKTIYKRQSPEIYVYTKNGEKFLASSAHMDANDMGITIDKFRKFAAEQGINLPAAMSPEEMMSLENLIETNRGYL